MKKIIFVAILICANVHAYVPTVESLFRNGSNPEVTSNAVSLSLTVKKFNPMGEKSEGLLEDVSLLKADRFEDYYRVFFNRSSKDVLKLSQSRYSDATYREASLEHRVFYSNFSGHTFRPTIENMEKGLFYGLLESILLNSAAHMINYLKSLGAPVRLNNELINRDKIELLASYKHYLALINKDRNAKKTETNPLRPTDPVIREKVERTLNESMYVDASQVKLIRHQNEMVWQVEAGAFEALVSYYDRRVIRIKYVSMAGEFEVTCHDYWLANGTHYLPKKLVVKTFGGAQYQVSLFNLRHYSEKDEDLVKRLKKWDDILKGKESTDPRPAFML